MKTYMYSNDDGCTWYNEICEAVEDNVRFFDSADRVEDTLTLTRAEIIPYEFSKEQLARLTDFVQESISEYVYNDLGENAARTAERVMESYKTELKYYIEGFIKKTISVGGIFAIGEDEEIQVKLADYE